MIGHDFCNCRRKKDGIKIDVILGKEGIPAKLFYATKIQNAPSSNDPKDLAIPKKYNPSFSQEVDTHEKEKADINVGQEVATEEPLVFSIAAKMGFDSDMQNDEFAHMPPLDSVHESNNLDLHIGDLYIPNNSNINR